MMLTFFADAKWFTREEILAVLDHPEGTNLSPRDPPKPSDAPKPTTAGALAGDANATKETEVKVQPLEDPNDPPFRVPPRTAIAGVLISDWARGKSSQLKGNL